MLLRPRRPLPPGPPSPASADLEAPGSPPASPAALATPAAPPASPARPVSPGSAQRAPWSERETRLLLAELLQPPVWRALLLDRRRALPTYRRVSAALARQQVRRTPAQCRRRYKFLKDKLRDAHDQPPGPFDAQIRELMALLGDQGTPRARRRSPGRPQRGRRSAPGALPDSGAFLPPDVDVDADADADASWTRSFSPSPPRLAAPAPGSPPPPPPRSPPPAPRPPSLSAALLQTLSHLGDIVAVLGPLRDQLQALNQHVEQLRGSFDQTVSLAVGFILGSAAAERGVLAEPRP
ncbi:undifferentiated embryonic cell transcription factor 1 [Erinaceus europaeus]|uniref:Undifferentiated embryonic cell transcription factor 1 n=1 Tax=Erinaceus europaeus TaxID=9365 RepID=A0ABM3VRH9_ERIEU|nr:undifferentiated embryonic cell transcription factor 1 [Erinaceus europaeus]